MKLEWPIIPNHITKINIEDPKDQVEIEENHDLEKLNKLGLMPNSGLRGYLSQASKILNNKISVYEFPPNNKNPVKTQAYKYPIDNHRACVTFNNKCGEKYCRECDMLHINLLRDLEKDNFKDELIKRINIDTEYKDIYKYRYVNNNLLEIRLDDKHKRYYIGYDCPLLGYRILIFPVFICDKVVSAVIIGQIMLEELINEDTEEDFYIQRVRNLFFNINDYTKPLFTKDVTDNINSIVHEHIKCEENKKHIFNNKEYFEFIESCLSRIDEFEEILKNKLENIKIDYIRENFSKYQNKFRKDVCEYISSNKENTNNLLNILWNITNFILSDMKDDFPVEHIVFFGRKTDETTKINILNYVAGTKKFDDYYFDLEKAPIDDNHTINTLNSIVTSIDKVEYAKNLLNGLYDNNGNIKLDSDKDLIRYFPSPTTESKLIIWVRYNKIWPRLKEEPKSKSEIVFQDALVSLYTVVSFTYSEIIVATSKENLKKTLKKLGHEIPSQCTFIRSNKAQLLRFFEKDIVKKFFIDNLNQLIGINCNASIGNGI